MTTVNIPDGKYHLWTVLKLGTPLTQSINPLALGSFGKYSQHISAWMMLQTCSFTCSWLHEFNSIISPSCCIFAAGGHWINAGLLSFGPLGTNFSVILIKIHKFQFTKMHLKMAAILSRGKWVNFCRTGDAVGEVVAWWGNMVNVWGADDKSTVVQVMAWCHQAPSHYLNQCWPSWSLYNSIKLCPCRLSSCECKPGTREFHGNKFNPVFSKKIRGQKLPWKVCNCSHISK